MSEQTVPTMDEPKPVSTEPVPVVIAPVKVVPPVKSKDGGMTAGSRPANTTAEQDRKTSGQRQINAVWEFTQAGIAVLVVITTSVGMFIGRVVQGDSVPFPPEWWTIVGLVIGFYFGRTNHARIGDEPRSNGIGANGDSH